MKNKSFSQANQDLFVLQMLNKKTNGVYLEIGGAWPFDLNNTALLEQDYEWRGFSYEIMQQRVDDYNKLRSNTCYCENATMVDYLSAFEKHDFPKQIDYLSLDIEPHSQTMKCLKKLPLDDYRFSVITYEHDSYAGGDVSKIESREILQSYGYQLVVSDLTHGGNSFEDWYVDPTIVDEKIYSPFIAQNIEHTTLFEGKL